VETWEGNKVDCELTEIRVELAREAEAACDTRHDNRDKMVEITICWGGELQGTEANVIESLVINTECLVSVLEKERCRECAVIWLNDSVGHLGGWDNRECAHHTIWVFLTNLGDHQSTHTRTCPTTKGVAKLESLKAIAALGFLADNIENRVNQLSTLGVVTLCPVVTCTSLSEDKVVRAEKLSKGTCTDRIHGTWFKIDKDCAGDILASSGFVEVNIDTLELEFGLTVIGTGGVNAVLV
jgi:hypothetical protein